MDPEQRCQEKLLVLRQEIPMAGDWQNPELFVWPGQLGEWRAVAVGMQSSNPKLQLLATGSACVAEVAADLALELAYYELLERCICLESSESRRSLEVCRSDGEHIGHSPSENVFPKHDGTQTQWAKSNGVALGRTWEQACQNAYLELVERHTVLVAWYANQPPKSFGATTRLTDGRRLKTYLFGYPVDSNVATAMAVLWQDHEIVAYGFGSHYDPRSAAAKADRECRQRAVFLTGETFDGEMPDFQPTPSYHQEFFGRRRGNLRLVEWLESGQQAEFAPPALTTQADCCFAVLAEPDEDGQGVYCVRALNRHLVPLFFGVPPAELNLARSYQQYGLHPML